MDSPWVELEASGDEQTESGQVQCATIAYSKLGLGFDGRRWRNKNTDPTYYSSSQTCYQGC